MGDEKPTLNGFFGLSIHELFNLILYIVIFTVVIIFILFLLGIVSINSISIVLGIVNNLLYSLTIILLFFFTFAILYTLFNWVRKDEGFTIQPFKIGGWNKDIEHNGHAISDLLIKELIRIQNIHEEDYEIDENIKTSTIVPGPDLVLPTFTPITEDLTYNISNLGTVSQGPLNISIGQLLITLKRLSGSRSSIITGSLQNYGTLVSIVAWMGPKKTQSWEVKRKVNPEQIDEIIPVLIRDLAYQISIDPEITKDTKAKTWKGFKYYSEALKAYHQYMKNDQYKYLKKAQENCLRAVQSEKNYTEPVSLIYTIGSKYFNNKDFKNAEYLFRKANELKPNNLDILIGLGTTLDMLDKDKEALTVLNKAINIAEKDIKLSKFNEQSIVTYKNLILAENNRASVLKDLEKYETALKSLDDAINNLKSLNESSRYIKNLDKLYSEKDFSEIWYNKGFILYLWLRNNDQMQSQNKYDEALKNLDYALELGFNESYIYKLKGQIFIALEDYEKSIQFFDKAIDLNSAYAEAWNHKGFALAGLGKYTSAISCFDEAIKLGKHGYLWDIQGFSQKIDAEKSLQNMKCTSIDSRFEYSEPIVNKSFVLSSLGRYDAAIKNLDEHIKNDPDNLESLNYRGLLLNLVGDNLIEEIENEPLQIYQNILKEKSDKCFEEAIDINFNKALEIDPQNPDVLNNKGYSLMRLGKYQDAINCFNKVIEINPEYISALNYKAIAFNITGRTNKAMKITYELIKDPKNFESYFNSGQLLNYLGAYDEAIECSNKAIDLNPSYEDAWKLKGYTFSAMGDYENAINCFDEARALNSENSENWFNKGYLLNEMDKHDEAIRCYEKVIDLDRENPVALNNKAYALYKLNKNKEAIKYYDKALELNPEYELALQNKLIALPDDDSEKISNCLNLLIDLKPDDPRYWYQKGCYLNEMSIYEPDKAEEAICCFDEAIKIHPNEPDYYNEKGMSLSNLGKDKKAINCYDKALEINENYESAWINKGISLNNLRMYPEAIDCYNIALEINEKNPNTWNNRGYSLLNQKNYNKAINDFNKAIAYFAEHDFAYNNKGAALNALSKYHEALRCIEKSISLNPDNPLAWKNKSDALEGLGKHDEALEALNTAYQMDPALKE